AILAFAFDYVQRADESESSERNWLRDETGGSVHLRLSTRPIEQIKREMTPELLQAIVDGGYWLRKPGPNCQGVVAYTGAVAPEAIQAVGLMAEDRRDVGLLAVTSADRLNAGWTAAQRAPERGLVHARSHIERLLTDVPAHCGIVSVLDGHPATLAWLGAVAGHRVRPLGVEHFGQTGALADLYRHYGIDANAIVAAAQAIAPGRPIRHLKALPCPALRAEQQTDKKENNHPHDDRADNDCDCVDDCLVRRRPHQPGNAGVQQVETVQTEDAEEGQKRNDVEYAGHPGGGRCVGRNPHRIIGTLSCTERAGQKIDDVGKNKHANQRQHIKNYGACQAETDANPIPVHSDQRRTDK